MQVETTTAKVKARLEKEGWELTGGTRHDKYVKEGRLITVPRHRNPHARRCPLDSKSGRLECRA